MNAKLPGHLLDASYFQLSYLPHEADMLHVFRFISLKFI